jgi:uncharacterized pyridoxal phosphate-containing UPF0001 family protein
MNIAFKKAINQITRKTSEEKALPAFKAVLANEIRRTFRAKCRAFTEEDVDRIVQENLECHREKGFDPGEVEKFKAAYSAMPRRGARKKFPKNHLEAL